MESVEISQQSGYCGSSLLTSDAVPDQFPAGLRVLLVDDDITCLKLIEQMLKKCMYAVTTCDQAAAALSLLREKKGNFDVVISDVHMPDMDGFKLLEIVGFEMDLPVIMMSADRRTSTVMRGVKHGACDFLIKPVRMEELNNIWQHVVRKKSMDNPENEQSGGENNDGRKGVYQEVEIKSSVINCSNSSLKVHRKRNNDKDEYYNEQANDDQAASKKSRVVWSVELHEKFVNAVSQLGIDKAVPKRILELMNVPDLSRENVASHLQKFRLYLKRISGVAQNPQNQGIFFGSFGGSVELNQRVTPTASINMQPLAVSGWTPQQPFASFRSCHSSSFVMPPTDQSTLAQAALNESKGRPMEHIENTPFMTTLAHLPKPWAQMNLPISDNPPGYSSWQQHFAEADRCNSYGDLNSCGDNFLYQQGSVHFDSSHAFNTRPTRVLASPVSCSFPSKNSSEHSFGNLNPNVSSFTGNSLDYKMLSPPSIGMQRSLDGDSKSDCVVGMYSPPFSVSSSASSCAIPCEGTTHLQSWPVHNSAHDVIPNPSSQISNLVPNASEIPFGFQDEYLLDQGTPTTGMRVVNASCLSTSNFTCESGQGTGFGHEHLVNKDMNTDFRNLPK